MSVTSSSIPCTGQRTVLLGDTALEDGFYHAVVLIAALAALTAVLAFFLDIFAGPKPIKRRWGVFSVNLVMATALVAICATPWAYFNVGHPLSDRIYQVRNLIAPTHDFITPGDLRRFEVDPRIWSCDRGPCDGDPKNTISKYHHRELGISFRFVLFSECMTPEFNLATAQAINADTTGFDGDRRRYSQAYFDREGRFVGPKYRWFYTPLMQSELSDAEKIASPVEFEDLINQLAQWDDEHYYPDRLPAWVDWSRLRAEIVSGETHRVHRRPGLLVGLRLNDGTELIGTQTQLGEVERAIDECGSKCEAMIVVDW